MSKTYTRTAAESGRTVTRVQEVISSPGRVAVRKYRNSQSQPGYGEDIRTRFPAFTAWRVGMTLRRDGYRRTVLSPNVNGPPQCRNHRAGPEPGSPQPKDKDLNTTLAAGESVLTEPPQPAKPPVISREVALGFYAAGRSAEGRRALAAVPLVVEAYAAMDGISAEQERAQLLAVADGIEAVTAEGLSRADAWYLAGLDQFQGPYPGNAAAA